MRAPAPLRFLWNTFDRFFSDGCPGMAAGLSFYTFFSLPALLALILTLAGAFMDPREVQRAILDQVGGLMGPAGAAQIAIILTSARQSDQAASLAAIFSSLALLFGATTAFAQLQGALNRAWNVTPDPSRGQLRNFLAKRIFSFGVVLAVAFLLMVSLAFSAGLTAFGTILTSRLGLPEAALAVVDWLFSLVVMALVFAAMFKLLPDAKVEWRDVWVGSAGTALLFVLGKSVIGYYLGRSDPASAYGAAGSLAIVLIWVYYTSMLVFFGAEFTRVWSEWFGRGVRPEPGAVEVVHQEKTVRRG